MTIGQAKRPLMCFVAVLSWSRSIAMQFYLGAHMENFLRGHLHAFECWGGVPRVLLYDNLKSAVLERQGSAIRFNPTLLKLANHYRFEARPVSVARGNEKGRVERAIGYIRTSFFEGREFADVDDLNAQAAAWCHDQADQRTHPEDKTLLVHQAHEQERGRLLHLPDTHFITDEIRPVRVGKTPYVRFDTNDYSIPHTERAQHLTVVATLKEVRVLDATREVARHVRSYDKGQQIEQSGHIDALVEEKHNAKAHSHSNRLVAAVPACQRFLELAAQNAEPLKRTTSALLFLLKQYGVEELSVAIEQALTRGSAHPNTVRTILKDRRLHRGEPVPLPPSLSESAQRHDRPVTQGSLQAYDELGDVS